MTSTPQAINAETSVSLKVGQIKKSISVSVAFTPDFATRLQQIFIDLFIITKQLRTLRTEEIELIIAIIYDKELAFRDLIRTSTNQMESFKSHVFERVRC